MGAHRTISMRFFFQTLFLVKTNLQLPASGPRLDCVQNVNIIVQHAQMQCNGRWNAHETLVSKRRTETELTFWHKEI